MFIRVFQRSLGMATGPSPTGIGRTFLPLRNQNVPVPLPVTACGEEISPIPVPERGSCTRQGPEIDKSPKNLSI